MPYLGYEEQVDWFLVHIERAQLDVNDPDELLNLAELAADRDLEQRLQILLEEHALSF